MTQKRFNRVGGYVYDGDNCISHFEDVTHRDDIVTLLNELHETNEQLRHDATILIQSNQDYRKENEQLKQSYKEFEDECQSTFNAMNRKQNDLYRKNFKLKEENEQLKKDIQDKEEIIELYQGFCGKG